MNLLFPILTSEHTVDHGVPYQGVDLFLFANENLLHVQGGRVAKSTLAMALFGATLEEVQEVQRLLFQMSGTLHTAPKLTFNL